MKGCPPKVRRAEIAQRDAVERVIEPRRPRALPTAFCGIPTACEGDRLVRALATEPSYGVSTVLRAKSNPDATDDRRSGRDISRSLGITVLWSSRHEPRAARVDRVLALNEQVIAEATPSQVQSHPRWSIVSGRGD